MVSRQTRGEMWYLKESPSSTNEKDGKKLSSLEDFWYGFREPFRTGLFFKIQLLALATFYATLGIGNLATKFLPTAINELVYGIFQRSYAVGAAMMGPYLTLTCMMPQHIAVGILLSIIYGCLMTLVAFKYSRGVVSDMLENLTKQGSAPNGGFAKVLGAFQSFQICIVATLSEEVAFRFLLPCVLQRIFVRRRGGRARDNSTIVTLCSILFAIAHLHTAGTVAALYAAARPTSDHLLIGCVNRQLVLTFLLAQSLLAPLHQHRGLYASWGAHAGFNMAAVLMVTVLNFTGMI